MDCADSRIARRRLRLSELRYKTRSRAGREDHCADALSRLPTLVPDRSVQPEQIPCLAQACSPRGWVAPNYGEPAKEQPVTLAHMLAAQMGYQPCQDLRNKMDQNDHSRFQETKEGRIVRVDTLDGAVQARVPYILRQGLLRLEHDVVRAGHPGINRMYAAIRRHYYWKSMAADVYDWVASCASCDRNRTVPRQRTAMLKLFPATDPFASTSMDRIGPLTETKSGTVFLLIIIDCFSKLVRAVPLAGITATDVSSVFFRDWISVYWPPGTVLTDNGLLLAALFFQGVGNLMGIRSLYTSIFYRQTNGQVERFNKTLLDLFTHYIEDHQDKWDELVSVRALA